MVDHDENYETATYTIKKEHQVGSGTFDDPFRAACTDLVPKYETIGENQGDVWVIRIYYSDQTTREEFEQCLNNL